MSAAREAVLGDLYGDTVTMILVGFAPAPSVRGEGRPSLHGMTHAQVTREMWPDQPKKHSDIHHSVCVDIRGPRGNLHGYVDADVFGAVCRALGVAVQRNGATETPVTRAACTAVDTGTYT